MVGVADPVQHFPKYHIYFQKCFLNQDMPHLIMLSLIYVIIMVIGRLLSIKKICSYPDVKIRNLLKSKRCKPKKNTSFTLPKLILFCMIIFQNTPSKSTSKFSELEQYKNNELFTNESVNISKNLSSMITKEQMNIFALSRIKCKNRSSFFRFLLLLSGDVNINPGPTNYPCSACQKAVRTKGVFCTQCGLWTHQKCENMSDNEYKRLLKITKSEFSYTCKSCLNNIEEISTPIWELLPFPDGLNETISENTSDVSNISSIEDKWLPFSNRGLHFLHINVNSLLSKIDELREIAKKSKAVVIGISESKLDKSVLDGEVSIDGYEMIRSDRDRHGGGVACYVRSDMAFNIRKDFSTDVENIFFDILLPNSKPILVGIVYRPPTQMDFLDKLSTAIINATSFDANEAYILGDLNINFINKKQNLTGHIKKYKEFCSLHALKQLITSPTRVTENTSTILDHVLTNSHDRVSQSGVIDIGLSDHQLIYCTRKIVRPKVHEHNYITIRSMKNYSQDIFLNALREVNFPNYSQFDNINEAYDDFIDKTKRVIDQIAPMKQIRVKGNNQDWFDDEIHQAIINRDKSFSIFKKTKLHNDNERYKKACNKVQRLVKRKKKEFIVTKLEQNIGKPKDLWNTVKSLGISSKSNCTSKICLKSDGNLSFDPKNNANIFMKFYSNLASELVRQLPTAPKKFGMDTVKKYYEKYKLEGKDFSFSTVTEDTILKLLQNTNPSKAAGLDNLAGKFLREGATVLVTPITEICNLSIRLSAFPEKCKIAKLKPLFKKGSKTEAKNYRPISLLPLISKIVERVIYDQTQNFLDKNEVLYKYQSGLIHT